MNWYIALVCLIASCNTFTVGNDLYFILATGRYITQHGIFYEDVFSMHQGLQYQAEQWLTGVLYWNIYDIFGLFGLSVIVSLFFIFTGLVYYKLYCHYGGKGLFFPTAVLLLIGGIYATARPQTISMFFFILFLYAIERGKESKKWYGVCLVCSTAIANFHGGVWFLLLGIVLSFFVQYYKEWKKYLLLLCMVVLAGMVNPYGLDMLGFAGGALAEGYHGVLVDEMRPSALVMKNIFFQPGLFAVLGIGVLGMTYKKLELRHILLFLGYWTVSMFANRGLLQSLLLGYPAVLAAFPYSEKREEYLYLLPVIFIPFCTAESSLYNAFFIFVGLFLLWKPKNLGGNLVLLTLLLLLPIAHPFSMNRENAIYKPSVLNVMDEYPHGTVFSKYGSVFAYFGYRPYIDSRLEVYNISKNKKADILGEYLAVKEGRLYFPDVVDKYKFDYILTEEGELTDTYMRDVKGYKKIYDNNGMRLYAKIK